MSRKRTDPARLVRFSVPQKDESVLAWLDEQDSISHSLRHLIREQVRREGVSDAIARPVASAAAQPPEPRPTDKGLEDLLRFLRS